MKTITINKHEVVFYESSEDLPILRYNKLNKFLMMDNGIGSSIEDFDKRMSMAVNFISKDMKDFAIQELENTRIFVYNSLQEYSPRNNALAMLVHSIDGEVVDITGDGLTRTLKRLDEIGLTNREATEIVHETKKKIEKELKTYFKKTFSERNSDELEDNVQKIAIMKLELKLIFENASEEEIKELKEMEGERLKAERPLNFNPRSENNVEVEMEADFKKLCFMMQSQYSENITKMSTFDFYALKEYLVEKNTKNNGNN